MTATPAMNGVEAQRCTGGENLLQSSLDEESQTSPIPESNGVGSRSQAQRTGRKRPRVGSIARLVCQDFGSPYISGDDDDVSSSEVKSDSDESISPSSLVHCVSQFEVTSNEETTVHDPIMPSEDRPNPLGGKKLLLTHVNCLRLEIELFPMRQLVARLMAHPTHNRRGLFNRPVDPVALGIPDYHIIITKPMDLGTVKTRLFSVAYESRDSVAEDIRLVFRNAIIYNPQDNPVHIAAKTLLNIFEESYSVIQTAKAPVSASSKRASYVANARLECSQPIFASARSFQSVDRTPSAPAILLPNSNAVIPVGPKTPPPTTDFSVSHTASEQARENIPSITPFDEKSTLGALPTDCDIFAPYANPARSSLRGCITLDDPFNNAPSYIDKALKRAKNVAAKQSKHSCRSCLGRSCGVCEQGCLSHEPPMLICAGPNCAGAKIRKGATYFMAKDGSRQFCQRCYTNLQTVLPPTSDQLDSTGTAVRYKRDLLKRKNDEEIAEKWVTCSVCQKGVHTICAMHYEFFLLDDKYTCPDCTPKEPTGDDDGVSNSDSSCTAYSFLSGSEAPLKLTDLAGSSSTLPNVRAEFLPETAVSKFIQTKVRACIVKSNAPPHTEKTVFVRPISSCKKYFKVPEVVRKHFRLQSQNNKRELHGVMPPVSVKYNSKSIALFQKIDGMDVCLFCMYVHEYDCDDDYKGGEKGTQSKRVYIAYLDSVEYFRPRHCRSEVYHEVLTSYLASARARGYKSAHIWACPPSRGNSFVFWNHPTSQRTPNKDHLISWYHTALHRGVGAGVITDVHSLFETSFPFATRLTTDPNEIENTIPLEGGVLDGRLICPPLMDGDFWVEEAVRIHAASIAKNAKARPEKDGECEQGGCPAIQVAQLLSNKIILHQSSKPFRKPVNAAALKLQDYHKIIRKPMDLGTVYSRCVLGEYETLGGLVSDVDLVFSNAKRYNPMGHVVHTQAVEMECYFKKELNLLVSQWGVGNKNNCSWAAGADISLRLDCPDPTRALTPATDHCTNRSVTPDCQPIDGNVNISPLTPGLKELADDCVVMNIEGMAHTTLKDRVVVINGGRKPVQGKPHKGRKSTSSKLMQDMLAQKLELLKDGEDAITQRMVGDDVWLLDKRYPIVPKVSAAGRKKGSGKRKKAITHVSQPSAKRRRQSWLGEEVGTSIRKMRNAFFVCSLAPKADMSLEEKSQVIKYEKYIQDFDSEKCSEDKVVQCRLADARVGLLEFSQYRNLEFDTLRRAKYSSFVLLYYLLNKNAPGLIPTCASCKSEIREVRWHRIRRVEDRYHTGRMPPSVRAARSSQMSPELAEACHRGEELCAPCFQKKDNNRKEDDFIPLPISFKV